MRHVASRGPLGVVRAGIVAAALGLVVPGGLAFGQPAPPPPVADNRFEVPGLPDNADVVEDVLVYPPRTVVPPHIHPGPNFVTLLEGEMVLHINGEDVVHEAGDTWIEPADTVHSASVISTTPARLFTTTIVPAGEPRAVPVQDPG